ncbi:MAG: hypothetical protein R6U55_02415 [Desulfovermiculus sp.]
MPAINWELSLDSVSVEKTRESLRFTLYCVCAGQRLSVIESASLEELGPEIEALEKGLKEIKSQAQRAWEKLPHEDASGPTSNQDMQPAQIWAQLEACSSHQELQDTFNNLPDTVRREVAQHVFSTVNMFAGAGSFFAQNYDHGTAMLG